MNPVVALEKKTVGTIEKAKTMVVKTESAYELANNLIKQIKIQQKEVKDAFDPAIKKAHEAHKGIKAERDKYLNPLLDAERMLKNKATTYYVEAERKRKAEEARINAAAEEKARKEKARLEAKAKKAEEKGDTIKADLLREQAEVVDPILIDTSTAINKPAGVSYRTKHIAVVVDFAKLPDVWKEPKQKELDKHAQNTKGQIPIPGVVFKSSQIQANRS